MNHSPFIVFHPSARLSLFPIKLVEERDLAFQSRISSPSGNELTFSPTIIPKIKINTRGMKYRGECLQLRRLRKVRELDELVEIIIIVEQGDYVSFCLSWKK
jgi:hypothetical protein